MSYNQASFRLSNSKELPCGERTATYGTVRCPSFQVPSIAFCRLSDWGEEVPIELRQGAAEGAGQYSLFLQNLSLRKLRIHGLEIKLQCRAQHQEWWVLRNTCRPSLSFRRISALGAPILPCSRDDIFHKFYLQGVGRLRKPSPEGLTIRYSDFLFLGVFKLYW